MTLRLRHLRLRAETEVGTFGADIPFKLGLNVLWADNTKGKSTCLQGLLYVLGLERMLSPRREVPLTYVMTHHLKDENGVEHAVLESSVWLEVENGDGRIVTIRRGVKTEANPKLVSVFCGPALTQIGDYKQADYWVLDAGAAKSEHGFHRFLADFVGWRLPTVRKFDNAETLLYVETLFPLFFVEQKAGWSFVPAPFPTFLQIRDVAQRAIEFVMALDTHENELARQRIELDKAEVKGVWVAKRDELRAIAGQVNAAAEGVPTQPTVAREELERAFISVNVGEATRSIGEELSNLRNELATLEAAEVPTVGAIAPEISAELDALSAKLGDLNSRRSEIFRSRQTENAQHASVGHRLKALEEDLQKNRDAKKLQNLGSVLPLARDNEHCPTCAQPIADTLLAQTGSPDIMSIDENINYIRGQIVLFKRVEAQSSRIIAGLNSDLAVAGAELSETSARIRALRADLVAPESAPSVAAVENRVRLQNRIQGFELAEQRFEEEKQDLISLATRYAELLAEEEGLPKERLSPSDVRKVEVLEALIRDQAADFGFGTFPPSEIEISKDNYRPQKEGFEFGFELSASDSIRLKWAYLLSLLELAQPGAPSTNHTGFVVFDEPRQQETNKISFKGLLTRAARAKAEEHQVIFATSEDRPELEKFLKGVPCHYLPFEGFLIKRLERD